MNNVGKKDKGNKRLGIDRREFTYTAYLPERRSGKDRRSPSNHRSVWINKTRSDIKNQQNHSGMIY
jgi:hypothetical protein